MALSNFYNFEILDILHITILRDQTHLNLNLPFYTLNVQMITQCCYVKNIQDFKMIVITQCHSYKLNGHTSSQFIPILEAEFSIQSSSKKIYQYTYPNSNQLGNDFIPHSLIFIQLRIPAICEVKSINTIAIQNLDIVFFVCVFSEFL